MSVNNLGDLSHSYAMRQRNISIRQDIDRFTQELSTGQVADVRDVLAGNHSYLTDIERRASILNGYNVATTEATIFTENSQAALSRIEETSGTLSKSLILAGEGVTGAVVSTAASEARSTLASMLGAVNSSAAGRYLFSGTASDQPPLPDADTVLAALRPIVAGAATPADAMAAATAWFDDPAGFEATLYQGSADGIGPFTLSETDTVAFDVRAVDAELKEVIKLAAVSALGDDPVLGFDLDAQADLYGLAGQAMLSGQDGVIRVQAKVGVAEARIDGVATRNAAEATSLEFAKAALLEVDPFEAATKLEDAQFQLQSLYSVTVRMSQLSLVNFL